MQTLLQHIEAINIGVKVKLGRKKVDQGTVLKAKKTKIINEPLVSQLIVPEEDLRQVTWQLKSADWFIENYTPFGAYIGEGVYGKVYNVAKKKNTAKIQAAGGSVAMKITFGYHTEKEKESRAEEMNAIAPEIVASRLFDANVGDDKNLKASYSSYVDHFMMTHEEWEKLRATVTSYKEKMKENADSVVGDVDEPPARDLYVPGANQIEIRPYQFVYIYVSEFIVDSKPLQYYGERANEIAEDDWYELYVQAMKFFKFMHSLGVYHRDLNSNNVLLRRVPAQLEPRNTRWVFVLIDFGYACGVNETMGEEYECEEYNFTLKWQKYSNNASREEMAAIDVLMITHNLYVFTNRFPQLFEKFLKLMKNVYDEVITITTKEHDPVTRQSISIKTHTWNPAFRPPLSAEKVLTTYIPLYVRNKPLVSEGNK